MRTVRLVLRIMWAMLSLLALTTLGAENDQPSTDQQAIIRQVAELVHAKRMLREHAAGAIKLSEEDLRRYEAINARSAVRAKTEKTSRPDSARLQRIAEAIDARQKLRAHTAGTTKLSDSELRRYEEISRRPLGSKGETSAPPTPTTVASTGASPKFVVRFAGADLPTMAQAIKIYSGKSVEVDPNLPPRQFSVKLDAKSAEAMLQLLEVELARAGLRSVPTARGLRLEAIVNEP